MRKTPSPKPCVRLNKFALTNFLKNNEMKINFLSKSIVYFSYS
jgi:hypothetical protein